MMSASNKANFNQKRCDNMKFSQLPVEVQKAVTNELHSVKIDHINQQCRYFKNYGYSSAMQYRAVLSSQPLKLTGEQMVSIIKDVLISMLKAGKDYLHVLPDAIAYQLRQNFMLSKAEIARKVQ
jgi:hypothetical protein